MEVFEKPAAFRAACDAARSAGRRVAFVPTMGALHDGHLELVRRAREHADWVAVSIFVNPTQFGPNEDLARYPRDLEGDIQKLASTADALFTPSPADIYLPGDATRVAVSGLSANLCGPFRPGHFEGVATVVSKLWNIVGPCVSLFGRKDYQQLAVLRRLAADLFFPVTVLGVPTIREADGLAMSSRNRYLSAEDRARALTIPAALTKAVELFQRGERHAGTLRDTVADALPATAQIDYVVVSDADALVPFANDARVGERALVALALRLGSTRLIDNVVLGEDAAPISNLARTS